MSRRLGFVLVVLAMSSLAASADSSPLPDYCKAPDIQKISLPVYPGSAGSPHFDYRYQVVRSTTPNAPTVIFIPGGPGGGSIGDSKTFTHRPEGLRALGLPDDANVIFTDPRTAGCNTGGATTFPDDSLISPILAADIIEMIRALNLKNYVIYGHSYGTLLGTEVASLATHGEAHPPLALVLTGVLGKSIGDDMAVVSGINLQWRSVTKDLPESVLAQLSAGTPIAGIDTLDWPYFLSNGIYHGSYVHNGRFSNELEENLKLLEPDTSAARLAFKTAYDNRPIYVLSDAWSDRLYSLIDCNEIAADDPNSWRFTGSSFVADGLNPCAGQNLDRPYDPGQWLVRAPIYYLSGDHDPAAPYIGAREHFESQTQAPHRYFMTIPGGGHDEVGMELPDCKEAFWKAVFNNGAGLAAVLKTCIAPIQLEIQ